jgi:DNA-directed RNA polymerase subunit RPC12/RpoP
MTNEILIEVACPQCLHAIDIREHGRHITCPACSSHFILQGHLCAACNHYHPQEQNFCAGCGAPMTRVCQKCKQINWAGDEYCVACGAEMDIFQLLHLQTGQATAERLREQQQTARQFKAQEQADSARRMAKLTADAEAFRREQARRQRIQQERDRRLLLTAAGVLLAFVIVVILFTIF